MDQTLRHPPFPALTWDEDGSYWRGPFALPWYGGDGTSELILMPDTEPPEGDPAASSPPGPAQVAAYERVVAAGEPLRQGILDRFRANVPELAGADWAGLEAFWGLVDVRIFARSRNGLAYVGLVFSCSQWDHGYEHGAGIVVHGDRLIRFGVAEVAEEESEALIDLGLIDRYTGE